MINVICNLADVSRTRTLLQSVRQYLGHVFFFFFLLFSKSLKSASLRAVATVIKDDSSMFIGSS